MKPLPPKKFHCEGFSLLEMILIIVVVSIAAVPMMETFSTAGRWLEMEEDIPAGVQLAQECAEHIMFLRRDSGYSTIPAADPSPICNDLTLSGDLAIYSRTVAVTARTNATLSACPSGAASCKEVNIEVTKGGSIITSPTFMLVEY